MYEPPGSTVRTCSTNPEPAALSFNSNQRSNLHLLVHAHADGHLDDHEESHAGSAGPRDDGQDEAHVGGDGVAVTAVERTGAPVGFPVVGEDV